MKCPVCENNNVECVGTNLYRCNDCGYRFFGEEDVEGNRAGYSRQAEAESNDDDDAIEDDTSEFDGALGMDDEDILFPP